MPSPSTASSPLVATPPADESLKSTYHPHLDGLRAIAIIGILFEHLDLHLPDMFRCGPLSVRFFFVLTGYFITMSLWRVQREMRVEGEGLLPLGRYYLARLLRTGPPFYLSLMIGLVFGIEEVRTNFLWLATFQANNYIAWLGYWPNSISHYWSLAVQEQFYALWPIVVLTLPKRWFIPTMAAFILFGLGFRMACIMGNSTTLARWVTLLGTIDSFAVGAVVAYLREARILERMWKSKNLVVAMPLVACGCFYLGRAFMTLPEGNVLLALVEEIDAVFLAWVLAAALTGMKPVYARALSWAPLVYVGKISYGVYVYHVFIFVLLSPLLVPYGMSVDHNPWARVAVLIAATILVASISWHWVEQPFLNWKKSMTDAGRKRAAEKPVIVVGEPVPVRVNVDS